jgi:hypothetical protein
LLLLLLLLLPPLLLPLLVRLALSSGCWFQHLVIGGGGAEYSGRGGFFYKFSRTSINYTNFGATYQ